MRRRILKIIFGACCAVIALAIILFSFDLISYVIYPTKSSSHKLSMVQYSGFGYQNKPVITLKHHVNGEHINDYVLVIKNGVHIEEPQSYNLPVLGNGTVEVNVELNDIMSCGFSMIYSAEDLYQKGLLIYLAYYDDPYVYFVSGKEKTCYTRATDRDEWIITTEAPSLRVMPWQPDPPWFPSYSGWKENAWVVNDIS